MHTNINNQLREAKLLPELQKSASTTHRTLSPEYVELHARSAFSFLRGASTPEELIATCAELKMPAMALLDNDGVYGAARFHLAAQKSGIKAHIGAEITVSNFRFQISKSKSRVPGPEGGNSRFKIQDSRFKIQDSRFQIRDSRFKTRDPKPVVTLPLLVRNRTGYQNLCRLVTL